jgi:hypothetical protein
VSPKRYLKQDFARGGCRQGVAPWKNFPAKKISKGTKVKIYSPSLHFLRNLRENIKGGTKGNFLD